MPIDNTTILPKRKDIVMGRTANKGVHTRTTYVHKCSDCNAVFEGTERTVYARIRLHKKTIHQDGHRPMMGGSSHVKVSSGESLSRPDGVPSSEFRKAKKIDTVLGSYLRSSS